MRPWSRPLSCLLLCGVMSITLARTLRWPNDWTEAHWLLDYRFGAIKRGLPGEVLRRFADLTGMALDEATIAGVALAATGLFCASLAFVAWRLLRAHDFAPAVVAALAAFLCSPFVVLTGHLAGYYEHLVLPMAIGAVWLVLRGRPWAGAALLAVTPFVHEIALLLVFPLFGFAWLARANAPLPGREPPSPWPLLLPLLSALAVSVVVLSPPELFVARFNEHLKSFPFVGGGFEQNTSVMLVLPSSDAFLLLRGELGARLSHAGLYGVVVPTLMVLVLLLVQRLRAPALSLQALLAAAVVLLPQGMQLIAWDLERIATWSLLTALLRVWVLAETGPSGAAVPGLLPVSLLAVAANFLLLTPLLDHESDRLAPVVRAVAGAVVVLLLLANAVAAEGMPWRERLRWCGRDPGEPRR